MPSKKIRNKRLKTYLDAKKSEALLLGSVDRHLQLRPNDRDHTVLHASEMADPQWCPRASWLRLSGAVPVEPEALRLRSSLVFAEGHDIHAKWQGWFQEMGVLWGNWECLRCGAWQLGVWARELPEQNCWDHNPHFWKYDEVPLIDPDITILEGSADGVVLASSGEEVLLEVKSIGPGTMRLLGLAEEGDDPDDTSAFSRISRPMRSHLVQTQIYLRLKQRTSGPAPERAVILYEHKADQKTREFVVTYNDRHTDHLFETAKDIEWALAHDREIVCPHGGCKKCAREEE